MGALTGSGTTYALLGVYPSDETTTITLHSDGEIDLRQIYRFQQLQLCRNHCLPDHWQAFHGVPPDQGRHPDPLQLSVCCQQAGRLGDPASTIQYPTWTEAIKGWLAEKDTSLLRRSWSLRENESTYEICVTTGGQLPAADTVPPAESRRQTKPTVKTLRKFRNLFPLKTVIRTNRRGGTPMKRNGYTALALAAALLISLATCGVGKTAARAAETGYGAGTVRFAEDYDEIAAALSKMEQDGAFYAGGIRGPLMTAQGETAPSADTNSTTAAESPANGTSDYTNTNVQVDGIDEGDIVKTDGRYLYILRSGELLILKADGADTAVVSRTTIKTDGTPTELYLSNGRVAVVSSLGYCYPLVANSSVDDTGGSDFGSRTTLDIYDVSDPTAPRHLVALGQDGDSIGSRVQDGTLYLVTQRYVYGYDEGEPRTYIPCVYTNGAAELLPAGDICICPQPSSSSYIVACAYDFADAVLTGSQSVLGAGQTLYMSPQSIYVSGAASGETAGTPRTESVYTVTDYHYASTTTLYRFDLKDGLRLGATGTLPGTLDSQFSLDENGGYLRAVTTENSYSYSIYRDGAYGFENYRWNDDNKTVNGLYVLDGSLNIVGQVDELAEGERVYAARFDGDVAYFCTYHNTDPLFAVDLSEPTEPKVLSALKISGFSEYLHPWAEGELLGVGYDADEETGSTGMLKLVLFDTADKTDVTAKDTLVTDCEYSSALYNHKAFLIDHDRNLIGFPTSSGYVIYGYDEAAGFAKRAEVDWDGWQDNCRGVCIGDQLYIVGQDAVRVVTLDGFGTLADCSLA